MGLPQLNCTIIQTITGYVAGVLGILVAILKSIEFIWRTIELNEVARNHNISVDYNLGLYCMLVATIAYSAVSILLIIGIARKLHLMILPWLIVNALLALALAPTVLFSILYGFSIKSNDRHSLVIFSLIIVLLCLVWTAVFILFMNMRRGNARNQLEMQNQKPFINSTPRYEVVQMNS